MPRQRLDEQADLFPPSPGPADWPELWQGERPPDDFLEKIRRELEANLALVTRATDLPWTNPTVALLTEKRFHSIAEWLPAPECTRLRTAFAAELDRIYGEPA